MTLTPSTSRPPRAPIDTLGAAEPRSRRLEGDTSLSESENGTDVESGIPARGSPGAPGGKSGRRSGLWVSLLVVVILAVIVAAVIGHTRNDDKPKQTTQPMTNTTVSPTEQKVLADYHAFWDAYLVAADPMRPDHPALQAHATAEELKQLVNSFSGAKASNVVFKGTYEINAKVTSVSGPQATVRDCIADHTGSYDATTGVRKDTDDPTRDLMEVQLKLIDGTWKVSRIDKVSTGCTAP